MNSSYKIDPDNITNFDLDEHGLQLNIIFWICVAGKTAHTIKRCVENLFVEARNSSSIVSPFDLIRHIGETNLASTLKRNGIGCYNAKAAAIWKLVNSRLNLKTCSYEDLKAIKGIGRKTAKCFLIHSRADTIAAGLDVHILTALRRRGYMNVPLATPSSDREYRLWENIVLDIVKLENKTVAEWDLEEWKLGRKLNKEEN